MLTEDEAKKRWCPFANVQQDGTGNRYPMDTDMLNRAFACCIASDCMAWRWTEQGHDPGDFPGMGEWPSTGFCGLASKE